MERGKFQQAGLKWLVELELVNDPQLINQLKLNILLVSPRIKEVELLIYREQKSMLVLLELSWIGRKFLRKRIFAEVEDILSQLLPSFRFRVTDDPRIMDLAIARVKHALTGGKNENPSNSSVNADSLRQRDVPSAEENQPQAEHEPRSTEGSVPDSVEPSKDGKVIFSPIGSSDRPEE